MILRDYLVTGGRLVLPEGLVEGGSLLVRGGLVEALFEPGESLPAGLPRFEARGRVLSPGLFELHIHGAGGIGFDALGPEGGAALRELRAFLRGHGVSTFLPTLVCDRAALAALASAIGAAGLPETDLPGIYLEGPFVNPLRRGGIPLGTLREPSPAALEEVLALAGGRLRMMTLAPELPGAPELARLLSARGILPALGHSDCELSRVELPLPPYSITHLFNAMSPFSHKEAGLALLPFVDRRPFVELNADGIHVNAIALHASRLALDPERLILISDAVVAAGLGQGEFGYHGRRVVSGETGVRYLEDGVLMGSNRLADEVLRNWIAATGASLPEAFRALTLNPARLLGLEARRGSLLPGREAEILVWEEGLEAPRFVAEVMGDA